MKLYTILFFDYKTRTHINFAEKKNNAIISDSERKIIETIYKTFLRKK